MINESYACLAKGYPRIGRCDLAAKGLAGAPQDFRLSSPA